MACRLSLRRAALRVLSARPASTSLAVSARPLSSQALAKTYRQPTSCLSFLQQKRFFASDDGRYEQDADAEQELRSDADAPTYGRSDQGSPSNNCYVGNLFYDVTEADLKNKFSQFGNVKNVKIIFDGRGLSKGFGYVEFEEQDSANRAVQEMDQEMFEGRKITVQISAKTERPQRTQSFGKKNPPSRTLFIGNMSFEMTDQDLNDLFRPIKNVVDVRVAIDRRTGQPRGFAHADFIDVASAEAAAALLENQEAFGRRLRIDYSMPAEQRRERQ